MYGVSEHLVEYVRTPLSEPVSWNSRWTYAYVVETPKHRGLRLELTLDPGSADPAWLPTERHRVIEADTAN